MRASVAIVVVVAIMVAVMVGHEVMGTDLISTAKAFPIGFPLFARDTWMTELIAIVHVEPAVIVEVFASTLDSVAESLVLGFGQIGRGHIPTAMILHGSGLSDCRSC